ncbi:Cation/acetate symporter OS=Ureibacillus acetophenoni OX=614649 GN=SAMN05877842_103168 PE=3 SV=1 [Ureibacillus acetophenoni]
MLTGLISALILVAVSPNVWNPVAGKAIFVGDPLVFLTNPAIVSVPLGFLGGFIGTLLSKEVDAKKYREVEVKAQTGISVHDVSH